MLPIEARKYIPISLSKVTLDWVPLGVHEGEKTTDVLLSAVYNDSKESYEEILKGCKLQVLGSEVEIFSTIRATVSPQDEVVAVLDCGASATRLYIVEKGVITKTHSIPLSGVELTNALSKQLGIEFEVAEEIKRRVGLLGSAEDPQVQKILTSTIERGVRELNTVIKRHEDTESTKVQKTILSGGGAIMEGFQPYISDAFSMPTELADPFSKVAYPAFLEDTLREAGSSFAVALGVAIRGFQSLK
jgi:type IV pilus assembly protein PilM